MKVGANITNSWSYRTQTTKNEAIFSILHALFYVKVACRVQIWKKKICQNSEILVTVLFKMTLYLRIYFAFTKNPINLSLFKTDTLNFTMYISTILTCPLRLYVIGLHLWFQWTFSSPLNIIILLHYCKETVETNKLLK